MASALSPVMPPCGWWSRAVSQHNNQPAIMKPKFRFVLPVLLAGIAPSRAPAQFVVNDPIHTGMNALNWSMNYGEWLTQIQTQDTQIQNYVEDLKRMGTPEQLAGQLGLDELKKLSDLTALTKSYQQLGEEALSDPLSVLRRTAGGKFTPVAETLPSGQPVQYDPAKYRAAAMHAAVAEDYRARSDQLAKAREDIQQRINDTASDLDAATDNAEVSRLQGKIAILQGQQEQLSREELLAAAQSTVQVNDTETQRQAEAQAAAEAFDQERRAAMAKATQGTIPTPKPSTFEPVSK